MLSRGTVSAFFLAAFIATRFALRRCMRGHCSALAPPWPTLAVQRPTVRLLEPPTATIVAFDPSKAGKFGFFAVVKGGSPKSPHPCPFGHGKDDRCHPNHKNKRAPIARSGEYRARTRMF